MANKNNKVFMPTNLPQYGFGSWLKKNAGTIGSVVGAGVGTLIAPGVGTSIGASLGGKVGGSVQQADAANTATQLQEEQAKTQAGLQQSNQYTASARPHMIPTFQDGGMMYANGGPQENPITIFENGGTHEENPNGGIPLGKRGLVEEGEVRFGDYIFSNRLS